MAKQLNLDELLECAQTLNLPDSDEWQTQLEALGTLMASKIAEALDVEAGEATFQGTGFAGTCAPFYPKFAGQECPSPLDEYDSEEWDDEEESL